MAEYVTDSSEESPDLNDEGTSSEDESTDEEFEYDVPARIQNYVEKDILIDESSPLHMAAQKGPRKYLEVMLDNGCSPNSINQYGNSLLLLSCMSGQIRGVRMLIERGADVNHVNRYGNTVLHMAAMNGHVKVIDLMVSQHNININK
eukprot:CAMPEP_0168524930 /NCGR_PEP_ID=MMETSP0405-20121227/10980_1 /TAXON_ID=498012 /ORGANISM="Trichosphaerium sp, Strain Am-I-7 wt" /LENGTH=146 /DNA_ID=CAMNT_0008547305 /DNA_START=30 /DNA_END=470 /DNA_ORIENTATION=-